MKVTLKESTQVVYQKTTHEITVDIDGKEYIIRNSEDDNGVEYYVFNTDLGNNFINVYSIEDEDIKNVIEKLANAAYDEFIFGERNVGKEVDMEELNDY